MVQTTVIAGPDGSPWATHVPSWVDAAAAVDVRAELDSHRASFEGPDSHPGPKSVRAPRLVLAFGDESFAFPDLGGALPWPAAIGLMRDRLAAIAGHPFNYVLVNLYRDGSDWTGWHADKVQFHETGSLIAVVSLGATRELHLRSASRSAAVTSLPLDDRSLLWMAYDLQHHYEHTVPACDTTRARFSLTFRHLRLRGAA